MFPALTPEQLKARSESIKRSWASRKKYVHTTETDMVIRRAYHLSQNFGNKRAIQNAAKQLGWPRSALLARARALNLATPTSYRRWTDPEDELLEQNGWMGLSSIVRKLKRAGFVRSQSAVSQRLTQLKIRASQDGYSIRQVSRLFGCDDKRVSRWIEKGLLKAKMTGRGTGANEIRFIATADVRRFLLNSPGEYDHRRIDKMIFLSLLCPHEFCEEFKPNLAGREVAA